jgi:hypothetical protein
MESGVRTEDRRYFAASALVARGAGRFSLAQQFEEIAAGNWVAGYMGTQPDQMASLEAAVPFETAFAALDMALTGAGLDEASS